MSSGPGTVRLSGDVSQWVGQVLRGPLGTRRARLAVLGAGVGVALMGLWLYLHKKRRPDEEDDSFDVHRTTTRASTRNRYSSLNERPVRRRGLHGRTSESAPALPQGPVNPDLLVSTGIDSLAEVVRVWERALNSELKGKLVTEKELYESLQDALLRCKEIQDTISQVAEKYNLAMAGGDGSLCSTSLAPGASMGVGSVGLGLEGLPGQAFVDRHRTMSILSGDSFVSALEELIPEFDNVDILDREALNLDPKDLKLYQDALKVVDSVPFRVNRADFLGCDSDEEFLAKLHCVRRAFNLLTGDVRKREWLVDAGRRLIAALLEAAEKDTEPFEKAYGDLLTWLQGDGALHQMEEELQARRVPKASFYDIVLDFILMDAFDDLAQPPSAVFAVTQNRFLSASFKENTLRTVVWSVLKSKRARLGAADGFIGRFYDVSEAVSPTLAWGFLGSDQALRELCYFFKDQMCTFMIDIFSFQRVRYTSLTDLAEDVWVILKSRVQMLMQRLQPVA